MGKFKKIAAIFVVFSQLLITSNVQAIENINVTEASPIHVKDTTDVIWHSSNNSKDILLLSTTTPLAAYKGASGVTIRSFTTSFTDTAKLKAVYDELMKNTIGAEISYLSYVDLVPNYPMGSNVAGVWHGRWSSSGKLAAGRQIEIFGSNNISFEDLASVLSHEYGHHFTYYHLLNKEGKSPDSSTSGYYKLRNLGSYPQINSGYHAWDPAEMAAEDYKQLFGSPTAKKSYEFMDLRDRMESNSSGAVAYDSYMFNVYPQENYYIPLAWQVNGLYSYWTGLSAVNPPNKRPPSAPFLTLAKVEKFNTGWGLETSATLSWTAAVDDTTTDVEYTVVYFKSDINNPGGSFIYAPIRTTTDSKGREAVIGAYVKGNSYSTNDILDSKVTIRVYAKDKDGNVAASNDLALDPANLQKSTAKPMDRIAGTDRYSTAVQVSQKGWTGTSDTIILATGKSFPDALSAGPLARKNNAPIILTSGTSLEPQVENEIQRLMVKNIIIIGGHGAVSLNVEKYLAAKGYNISRIGGKDRYETSVEIAKQLGVIDRVVVATGSSFPDALSIASYASSKGIPILLTDKNILPEKLQEYLSTQNINKSYVVGGTGVVSEVVGNSLPAAERISGANRYATNEAILNKFKIDFNFSNIYVATGINFPDALSGSVLASLTNSPIVLTDNHMNEAAKSVMKNNLAQIEKVNFIGGEGVISSSSALAITSSK